MSFCQVFTSRCLFHKYIYRVITQTDSASRSKSQHAHNKPSKAVTLVFVNFMSFVSKLFLLFSSRSITRVYPTFARSNALHPKKFPSQ